MIKEEINKTIYKYKNMPFHIPIHHRYMKRHYYLLKEYFNFKFNLPLCSAIISPNTVFTATSLS